MYSNRAISVLLAHVFYYFGDIFHEEAEGHEQQAECTRHMLINKKICSMLPQEREPSYEPTIELQN